MRFKVIPPLVSVFSLVLGSASVYAADVVNLRGKGLQETQKQFQMAIPGIKAALAVSSNQLKLIRQHQDAHHITHSRMQQQYAGFDVIGGYAIVHSAQPLNRLMSTSNQAVAANQATLSGIVYEGLEADLGHVPDHFVQRGEVALQYFAAQYSDYDVTRQQVTPVIYVDAAHQAHWAYKVSVFVEHQDNIPERPMAILDAQTFKSFVNWNDIKTAMTSVKGVGFGGNHKTGEYAYGSGTNPYLELSRDNKKKLCYMQGGNVKVVDMKNSSRTSNKTMQFSCVDKLAVADGVYSTGYKADGYDRINGAFSPTNDALYIGYVINHLYKDWYNLNALSLGDGSAMELVMRVHYSTGYENAFWDGEQMTFGDGEDFFYPLVSLGVGAHEISHGFTEQHADLQYYGESGGMNEAFSDMAAQAAEYYSAGKNSWMIGAEIMKEESGYEALRYMDVPSRDGESIDSAKDYYEDLDVHYSSGVYNRLFYLLANQSGWDTRKSFDVMVKANMDYWTPYSTFVEGGCGVVSAAQDLKYSVDDVKNALHQVGIETKSCKIKV